MDFELPYRFFTESHDALIDGPGELDLAVANTVVWACAVDEALEASGGENYKLARSAVPALLRAACLEELRRPDRERSPSLVRAVVGPAVAALVTEKEWSVTV